MSVPVLLPIVDVDLTERRSGTCDLANLMRRACSVGWGALYLRCCADLSVAQVADMTKGGAVLWFDCSSSGRLVDLFGAGASTVVFTFAHTVEVRDLACSLKELFLSPEIMRRVVPRVHLCMTGVETVIEAIREHLPNSADLIVVVDNARIKDEDNSVTVERQQELLRLYLTDSTLLSNGLEIIFELYSLEISEELTKTVGPKKILRVAAPGSFGSFIENWESVVITRQHNHVPWQMDVLRLFLDGLKSDRADGLFPTVVTDAPFSEVLGLVYSSRTSLAEALRTESGVYWSRSRNSLWVKGETSGNRQILLRISVDCDSDALKFDVRQQGEGFCHLARPTCWGERNALSDLENTLRSRKHSSVPQSYTRKLFDDPVLLRNKLVEEAQELAEAHEPQDVAAEAADLLYFLLTRCVQADVPFSDVCTVLQKRTLLPLRRAGLAKPHRVEAAAKILVKDYNLQ